MIKQPKLAFTLAVLAMTLAGCTLAPRVESSAPEKLHQKPLAPLLATAPDTAEEEDADSEEDQAVGPPAPPPEPVYSEENTTIDSETGVDSVSRDTEPFSSDPPPSESLWPKIRDGLALHEVEHADVARHRSWYAAHPTYLTKTFERARPFLYHIVEKIEQRRFPMEIALLPVVESGFQPHINSPSGAAGLWQFLAGTAQNFDLKINRWYDGRRDTFASTEAALNYLDYLQKRFDGDWLLAFAAYNLGEGAIDRAIQRNRQARKPTDLWSLPIAEHTRGYVARLLALSDIVKAPQQFRVKLPTIPNRPQLATVNVGSQIDMATAAKLADLTLEEIYHANTAVTRRATDPNGPHTLILPLDRVALFKERLAQLPPEQRLQTGKRRSLDERSLSSRSVPPLTHRVATGETLGEISRNYQISLATLASRNGLSTDAVLDVGQLLVISRPASPPELNTTALASQRDSNQPITYTVKKGDTLSHIADYFDVTIAKISQWNRAILGKLKRLQPGQKLTLYVDRANKGDGQG
ncbi:MAG: membrane-bound lytic murein transglycosylase [Halothiobacillaceae bacterium]|nr:MAG: membrane-bound lytic murein transglycosylase [Halothiobacillaceae bacterium]